MKSPSIGGLFLFPLFQYFHCPMQWRYIFILVLAASACTNKRKEEPVLTTPQVAIDLDSIKKEAM
jgi:hypothetical protein